jgi:hypothetical protein
MLMAEADTIEIVVTPIDPSAKGSRKQRRDLLAASRKVLEAQTRTTADDATAADTLAMLDAIDAAEAAMLPYLRTSDGSPLADALDDISIDDFNALTSAILGGSTATVPPANNGSSPGG